MGSGVEPPGGVRGGSPAFLKSFYERKVPDMGKLAGKKLLLLGERDGVPGPAMEACLKDSGAEIIFSATECFV